MTLSPGSGSTEVYSAEFSPDGSYVAMATVRGLQVSGSYHTIHARLRNLELVTDFSITDNSSKVTGCSRIFLDPLGGLAKIEAPKRVLGELHGNGIRFGPWQQARDLIIGEGLENTLSVGMAFPTAALVSCLTANHMAAFVWPSSVRRLWIAHDNDVAGLRGAKNLKSRFEAAQGQAVLLCPIRDDFNLDLIAEGVTALRHRLSALISEQITGHDLWPDEQAA